MKNAAVIYPPIFHPHLAGLDGARGSHVELDGAVENGVVVGFSVGFGAGVRTTCLRPRSDPDLRPHWNQCFEAVISMGILAPAVWASIQPRGDDDGACFG